MLNQKSYSCGICKTKPDQISHHKSHIDTQKHRDKRELFELKLTKLTDSELINQYGINNIADIVRENETIIYTPIDYHNSHTCNNISATNSAMNTLTGSSSSSFVATNAAAEQSNSVSNKEALKDKIHEIHNYLRNNGAGYGMNALKVFNLIYGLKKIEENGLLDKVGLAKPACEFSHLLALANEDEGEQLAALMLGPVLDSIHSKLKDLLFYEIPRNLRGSVLVYLIKEIDKITIIEKTCNVLLSGKIYEYFIGRDESAISELGAYFTDRHITKYCLQKVNPTLKPDGTIPSMIDMFGGSGGFTTEYINHLNEQYPQLINWATEINRIYHYDMNEDVLKSAGLEFFCLTGVLPNMANLRYKNSFKDEFVGPKYDYIFTNPPYGGDKNSTSNTKGKRDKVKTYIKQELNTITDEEVKQRRLRQLKAIEAQDRQDKKEQDRNKVCLTSCSARIQKFAREHNKLQGNDKESCSLMLLMDLLEVGGTAVGVLKEGVFFNKTYKDLRKCLIEHYNVREVISVPQDQFENTSTKTSIIIFDNTDNKTTEVKFSELTVEKYDEDRFAEVNGDIVIVENKDDIKCISDKLVSQATREELLSNPICSLNGQTYDKTETSVGEGYELIKLGDISEINIGSTPSTTNHRYWNNGTIPWVAVSDLDNNIIYDTNKYITEHGAETMKNRKISINSILLSFKLSIGKLGIAGREMYCNEAITYLNSVKSTIPQMYLYFILDGLNLNKYGRGTIGSSGNLNKEILKTIPIPIPKSPSKMQKWVDRISAPYNEKHAKQAQIHELELHVQNRIKEITEQEECDVVELGSLIDTVSGDYNTKANMNTGIYPVYGGGNISNYVNIYNRENELIINKDGMSSNCVKFERGKFFLNHHGWTLIHKNLEYKQYINYWIYSNQSLLFNKSNGSAQKGITKNHVSKLKIKIPKNKQLVQDLEPTFQRIESLQHEVKVAEESYRQSVQELSHEAMPTL
jgi:type I restriction-modification system DNA methylase subunit/restriction endonuclease S subunit